MSEETFHLPSIPPEDALAMVASGRAELVDVRKSAARHASGADLAGTRWHDPLTLGPGHPLTEARHPVIFFCVHGHEVSRFACALLLVHGADARYVEGGFAALSRAGAKTVPLDAVPEAGEG